MSSGELGLNLWPTFPPKTVSLPRSRQRQPLFQPGNPERRYLDRNTQHQLYRKGGWSSLTVSMIARMPRVVRTDHQNGRLSPLHHRSASIRHIDLPAACLPITARSDHRLALLLVAAVTSHLQLQVLGSSPYDICKLLRRQQAPLIGFCSAR